MAPTTARQCAPDLCRTVPADSAAPPALRDACRRWLQRLGWPDAEAEELLEAATEAVTNVVRHSDADECTVDFGSNGLTVTDDGRGLGQRAEGNGIRGLRERVAGAGGTMTLETGPEGHGTVLEVTM